MQSTRIFSGPFLLWQSSLSLDSMWFASRPTALLGLACLCCALLLHLLAERSSAPLLFSLFTAATPLLVLSLGILLGSLFSRRGEGHLSPAAVDRLENLAKRLVEVERESTSDQLLDTSGLQARVMQLEEECAVWRSRASQRSLMEQNGTCASAARERRDSHDLERSPSPSGTPGFRRRVSINGGKVMVRAHSMRLHRGQGGYCGSNSDLSQLDADLSVPLDCTAPGTASPFHGRHSLKFDFSSRSSIDQTPTDSACLARSSSGPAKVMGRPYQHSSAMYSMRLKGMPSDTIAEGEMKKGRSEGGIGFGEEGRVINQGWWPDRTEEADMEAEWKGVAEELASRHRKAGFQLIKATAGDAALLGCPLLPQAHPTIDSQPPTTHDQDQTPTLPPTHSSIQLLPPTTDARTHPPLRPHHAPAYVFTSGSVCFHLPPLR